MINTKLSAILTKAKSMSASDSIDISQASKNFKQVLMK
jgi:hypothetical protein